LTLVTYYALADKKDQYHERALEVARTLSDQLVLPVTVLPEICYLIDSRLGHAAMREFVDRVPAALQIEGLNQADLERASEILDRYADARIDFVDATLFAIAERLNITRILTTDHRHFRLFRPKHCATFELMPSSS
jgi:uncharacterized protein